MKPRRDCNPGSHFVFAVGISSHRELATDNGIQEKDGGAGCDDAAQGARGQKSGKEGVNSDVRKKKGLKDNGVGHIRD